MISSWAKSKDFLERYLVKSISCNYVISRHLLKNKHWNRNVFLIMHARVSWQSPERVPLVFYCLWQTIIFAVVLLHSVVLVCHCWCKSPTAPLPRPPTPHGQRRTLFILAIENCFVADIYLTLLNGTLIDKSPLLWKIMLQVFVLQFTITPFSEIKVIA